MAGYVNIGGVWRPIKPLKCNIGGVWKTIQSASTCVGGVWKSGFTNTLILNNFLDTSVFAATRSLKLNGRDVTSDNERYYILRAEASRLYVYYKGTSDSVSGSITIKTVSPIDFTGYSKVVLTSGRAHEINCDYSEDGSPMSSWRDASVTMGIIPVNGSSYTKQAYKGASANYQSSKIENFTNLTLDVSDIKGSYYLQVSVRLYAHYKSSGLIEGYAVGPITIS